MRVVITGMGVCAAGAGNQAEFLEALREGRCGIRFHRDPQTGTVQLGAFLADDPIAVDAAAPNPPLARSILRGAPRNTAIACAVALEAYAQARGEVDFVAEKTALVVAGNNLQQRYIAEHYQRFAARRAFMPPRYALHFMDTYHVGAVSELLGIRGPGFTAGGASASGNVALYQACQLLQTGEAVACVCLGPFSDFSDFEFQGFSNLGAMHPGTTDALPETQCRPFDRGRRGFVFGQASGCVILETLDHARGRGATVLAELAGVSLALDGNHSTDPSADGEARAMRLALRKAGLEPEAVDYLNAHGTASAVGDDAECAAIRQVFGTRGRPAINATKRAVRSRVCRGRHHRIDRDRVADASSFPASQSESRPTDR